MTVRSGARDIIEAIQEYPELRIVQTRDILRAIRDKIQEGIDGKGSIAGARELGQDDLILDIIEELEVIDRAINDLNYILEFRI